MGSEWMKNPNVKLLLFMLIAGMPTITTDMSAGKASWLTVVLAVSNMLIAARAFMSDPNGVPPVVAPEPVAPPVPPVPSQPPLEIAP